MAIKLVFTIFTLRKMMTETGHTHTGELKATWVAAYSGETSNYGWRRLITGMMKAIVLKATLLMAVLCSLAPQQVWAQANDSIPFIYHGHLYIHSIINDSIHCNAIFDTGAANMFGVDSVFLEQSDWHPKQFANAYTSGVAGKTKVRIITDWTKVNIGNIEDHYAFVPIFKLRDVVDCHIDGIWGIKNIADYPFEINFEHSYLKQHKAGIPNLDGYQKLPIRYENDKIMLQAETHIGGTVVKGWYLMDTGGGGSVDFTAKAVKDYRLEEIPGKRYIEDMTQMGIGDKEQEWFVNMQSDMIVIGNDTIRKESISYFPEGEGAISDRPYLGIIGNNIWSNYNMILDVRDSLLWIRRFKPDNPPGPFYDFGFRNRTDICRGWIVSRLTRDGDAVGGGMQLGDTIIAVNGRSVADYTWDEEYSIEDNPLLHLDLVGADGKEKHIVLESKEWW